VIDNSVQWILLRNIRPILMLVCGLGVLCYLVDYRPLRSKSQFAKEARFSQIASLCLIGISIAGFVVLQVVNWLS
jgi:hypothetical protein